MGKRKVSKGKGMIIVQVRFFTTDLKDKAVWDAGAIYMPNRQNTESMLANQRCSTEWKKSVQR